MIYFFVLGRNPELSLIEIFSYVKREGNSILNCVQIKNSALIEFSSPLQKEALSKLGGTISMGEIISKGKINDILQQLEKKEIYSGIKNNLSYILLNFAEDSSLEKISEYLKKRFKIEKLKASEKKLRREISSQNGEKNSIVSSGSLIDEQYFLFGSKEELFFGKIIEKCNYKKIEERDMKKPVRRQELSISPRLAKIMINLSEIKIGQTLLDPFCGIGVILQEALLQKIKTIGIDKNKEAIVGARNNLEWFKFSKENYSLITSDSAKIKIKPVNVLVTEPNFGETLKKIPSSEQAKKMQQKFERLMIEVLNNLKKSISGRVVFTAPLINIGKKRLSCDIKNIIDKTHFKLVEGFPIKEFRNSQIVGREIYVLKN
jgi:tRNA G10  N-methylase Trm11